MTDVESYLIKMTISREVQRIINMCIEKSPERFINISEVCKKVVFYKAEIEKARKFRSYKIALGKHSLPVKVRPKTFINLDEKYSEIYGRKFKRKDKSCHRWGLPGSKTIFGFIFPSPIYNEGLWLIEKTDNINNFSELISFCVTDYARIIFPDYARIIFRLASRKVSKKKVSFISTKLRSLKVEKNMQIAKNMQKRYLLSQSR